MKVAFYSFASVLVIATVILLGCETPDNAAGGDSDSVDPTDSIVPSVVKNVNATRLESTSSIYIYWDSVEEADSYEVYRYTSISDPIPEPIVFIINRNINQFTDYTADEDTPYYYKVASVKGSEKSDKSANYVQGIYSSQIDCFEPNEDINKAVAIGSTSQDVLIYSFHDGRYQDTDWYKYTETGENSRTIRIIATLPTESPFVDGEEKRLTLKIDGGDSKKLGIGNNYLDAIVNPKSTLYFKIYFPESTPENFDHIGSYAIQIIMI